MAHERLIDDLRHRQRGTDARRQEQLEAMRHVVGGVIRRAGHQPADRDVVQHELALACLGSNAKPAAAAGRRLPTTLTGEPSTQRLVGDGGRAQRVFVAFESNESDSSAFDPADLAIAVKEAKAAVTVFKDAQ
jgi:hypothetical protein